MTQFFKMDPASSPTLCLSILEKTWENVFVGGARGKERREREGEVDRERER